MDIKKNLNKKVSSYLDQLFSGVGDSQQLFELKEELTTNLKERITDYKKMEWMKKKRLRKQ